MWKKIKRVKTIIRQKIGENLTLYNFIYKIAIKLARNNISPETLSEVKLQVSYGTTKKQYKYLERFIVAATVILFFLTSFSYHFFSEGPLFGVKISVNIIPAIIEIVMFGILTYLFLYYQKNFNYFILQYKHELLYFKEVTCAYDDDTFGKKTYTIVEQEWNEEPHIHVRFNDDKGFKYYFNDYRIFKFVDVKNSRKMKLEKLMSNGPTK